MTFQTFPEGWRPVAGDSIEGIVTSMEIGWSDQTEDNYPIIVLRLADDTEKSIHCFHYSLKTQVISKKVRPGERVKITQGEKVPLKNNPNRSIVPYKLELPDRTPEQFDAQDFYSQISGTTKTGAVKRDVERVERSDIPVDEPEDDDDIPF